MKRTVIYFLLFFNMCHALPLQNPRYTADTQLNPAKEETDYPFPTERTFSNKANFSITKSTEFFDPDLVKKGDTIYLQDWLMPWFIETIHPEIKYPYILISNDTDGWHPDSDMGYLRPEGSYDVLRKSIRTILYDEKLAFWFCKNMIISRHPKILQIPIGQNIIYWGRFPEKEGLEELSKKQAEKKHLLYMNMQLATHSTRQTVANLFRNQSFCLDRINELNQTSLKRMDFYKELSESVFTPCPPGYGPDTVRFWEAVTLDTIPIVVRSNLDDLYEGLPVLFVHKWEEVTLELLLKSYKEIKSAHFSKEKAYFPYWANQIDLVQEKVRSGTNTFSKVEATNFEDDSLERICALLQFNVHPSDKVLLRGSVMGLRPFQLAHALPSVEQFLVQDYWGAMFWDGPRAHLDPVSSSLFHCQNKIQPINWESSITSVFERQTNSKSRTHVYFDLSFKRHLLFADLSEAYASAPERTLLCGNNGQDPYVREILDLISNNLNLEIEFNEDIWFIEK
jgi:hypothetical protein